jgi:DinB family protein
MSEITDLLERFRRGPELVALVLTGVFGEEEDFAPGPGQWTVRQIAAHLADSELVCAQRMRQIVAEENPVLMAFDQEAWTRNLDYARRKPKQSLESFRRMRGENYDLLKGLPETAYTRTGNHSERGTITLLFQVELLAQHAEAHARQMQAVREEYKRVKSKK